jgi:hypothetical protein
MSFGHHHNKTLEEYRQIAEKCRQTARKVSAENERNRLLKMAQTSDRIAERVGRPARSNVTQPAR